MELFPAANENQWLIIKRVIDDCDYYVLIIGGRYGSIGLEGISYTELEYRYALPIDKPTIAFLHKDPGLIPANKSEESEVGREKLRAFRALIRANELPDRAATFELLRLRKQVDELETELRRVRTTAPQGTENLAQGAEEFTIRYSLTFGLYPGERICQQPSRQLGTIFLQPSPL